MVNCLCFCEFNCKLLFGLLSVVAGIPMLLTVSAVSNSSVGLGIFSDIELELLFKGIVVLSTTVFSPLFVGSSEVLFCLKRDDLRCVVSDCNMNDFFFEAFSCMVDSPSFLLFLLLVILLIWFLDVSVSRARLIFCIKLCSSPSCESLLPFFGLFCFLAWAIAEIPSILQRVSMQFRTVLRKK